MKTQTKKLTLTIAAVLAGALLFVLIIRSAINTSSNNSSRGTSESSYSENSNDSSRYGWGSLQGIDAEVLPAPDLAKPDLLMLSQSLSDLPKDLAELAFLKHFLKDSLLFHYEESETWLDLAGLFRRITYENNLELDEKLLHYALNSKAQIALWRGAGGQLKQYMVVLEQDLFLKATTELLQKIGDDNQIQKAGMVTFNGEDVSRYKLQYGNRVAFFAVAGGQMVLYSNPKMTLPKNEWAADQKTKIDPTVNTDLPEDQNKSFFAGLYGLASSTEKHHIIFNAEYMALGYHRLIPAVQGVRYSFSEKNWKLYLLAGGEKSSETNAGLQEQIQQMIKKGAAVAENQEATNNPSNTDSSTTTATTAAVTPAATVTKPVAPTQSIWAALPDGPALCLSTAWDSRPILPILIRNHSKDKTAAFVSLQQRLGKQVAACWYEKSGIFQPVFVTTLATLPEDKALLHQIFKHITNAGEEKSTISGKTQSSNHSASFASVNGFLIFSPDKNLVQLAVDSLNLKTPALADRFPKQAEQTFAVVYPKHLSGLLEKEASQSLGKGSSQLLEDFNQLIRPGLQKMAKDKALYLLGPGATATTGLARWEELSFNNL